MLVDQIPSAQPEPVVPSSFRVALPTSARQLYNHDLGTHKREGRRWSGYNIFALWANDVHSLGNYGFALGCSPLASGGWQILVSLGIGAALLFVLLTISATWATTPASRFR